MLLRISLMFSDVTIEEGSLGVAKNTIIGGELNVDGEADFDKKVTVDDDLKVKRKLSVDKESYFKRDIEVRGTIEARDEVISQQFTVGEDEYGKGRNANITFGSFTAGCNNGHAKNGLIVSGDGLFAAELGARNVDASGTVCAASVDAPGIGGSPGLPTNPLVVQSLQITGGTTGPVINLSSGSGPGGFSGRKGLIVDQPMFSPQIGAQSIGTESNIRIGGEIVFGDDGTGPRITSGRKTVNNLNVGGSSSESLRGIVIENLASDNILVDTITAGTYFNLPAIVEPFEANDQCACVEEKWINSVNADIASFQGTTGGSTSKECQCNIDDVADDLVGMGFFTMDDAQPVLDRLNKVEKAGRTIISNITSIDERLKDVESTETTLSSNVTSMNNLIVEMLGLNNP